MKKIFIQAFFILSIITITFSSCEKKYVDGPRFSLRSAKARVSGDWKLDKMLVGGVEQPMTGVIVLINIEKDGKYTTSSNGDQDARTWSLGEDKDDIRFQSSTSGVPEQTFRILKLKNKELWWKLTQSDGTIWEYHLIPA